MTRQSFKRLIILQWLLGLISLVVYFATIDYLPQPVKDYFEEIKNAEPTIADWLILVVGSLLFLAYIVIYVGLYRFRKWAKKLLLPIHIVVLITLPFIGISVATGWVNAISYLSCLINGGILFLVYLPPISQMFETNGNN